MHNPCVLGGIIGGLELRVRSHLVLPANTSFEAGERGVRWRSGPKRNSAVNIEFPKKKSSANRVERLLIYQLLPQITFTNIQIN